MRVLLANGSNFGASNNTKVYDILQGVGYRLRGKVNNVPAPTTTTTVGYHNISISPNKKNLVSTNGANNTAQNMSFIDDWDGSFFPTWNTHSVSFGGTVRSCATSDAFRAYCGTSPFLYVFDSGTGLLVPVSTTGLGDAYIVSFSPNGSHMVVVHSGGTRVRIYRTSDWTHVDAPSVLIATVSQWMKLLWLDDSRFVISSQSANNIVCYRVDATSDWTVSASTIGNTLGSISVSGSRIYFGSDATSPTVSRFGYINSETGAVTRLESGQGSGTFLLRRPCYFDPIDNRFICSVNSGVNGTWMVSYDEKDAWAPPKVDNAPLQDFYHSIRATESGNEFIPVVFNTGKITGSVRSIDNLPVAREVNAYSRESGLLIARTMSDAVTGDYTLHLPDDNEVDVRFRIQDGEQLNDLFYARVKPELVP